MSIKELIKKTAKFIQEASYVVALTGAGISTSAGIPDFRSPGSGLFNDPEKLFLFTSFGFASDAKGFYKLGLQLLPTFLNAKPTRAHLFLAEQERMGKLKCVVTQNIDSLHQKAGSKKVLEVHGSLNRGKCIGCGKGFLLEEIARKLTGGEIPPLCGQCQCYIKPSIVLFGEPLPDGVFSEAEEELKRCDLLLVIGSSLLVYPVAELPVMAIEHCAKLVLINHQPTEYDHRADVVLQTSIEEAIQEIQKAMV